MVKNFYLRSDISYTAPGMKETMVVWSKNGKEVMSKHYLNMFLKEAFSIYDEIYRNTPHEIKLSSFKLLRTINVLATSKTPHDACKCQLHENLFFKLDALGLQYNNDFWKYALCNTEQNSDCWQSKCTDCKGEIKVKTTKLSTEKVTYKQWESCLVENENGGKTKPHLKIISKQEYVGQILDELKNNFETYLNHINIKRI